MKQRLKGFLSRKFIAFIVVTYFAQKLLFNGQSDEIKKWTLITWLIITVIFMLANAFEKFIEKGKLNVDADISLKAGGK